MNNKELQQQVMGHEREIGELIAYGKLNAKNVDRATQDIRDLTHVIREQNTQMHTNNNEIRQEVKQDLKDSNKSLLYGVSVVVGIISLIVGVIFKLV